MRLFSLVLQGLAAVCLVAGVWLFLGLAGALIASAGCLALAGALLEREAR